MIGKIRAIKLLTLTTVVLLICIGFLTFGGQGSKGNGDGGMKTAAFEITNIPVNEVMGLAVINAKTRFGLLVNGEELEMVSDVEGNYSLTELRSLIYAASHLVGSRKITDLTYAGQYGLDQPIASIALFRTDGTQIELSILSQNPMDGNYYLYSHGDQAIYLIAANVAEIFLRKETDFFSHTVLPVINASNLQNLDWVSMDFGGVGRDYRVEQKNGSLSLAEPIAQRLTMLAVMQKLLMPLSALYSDEFVASGAAPSEYGFDDYTLRVEMMYGGQQYVVLLLDKGDGRCLMADEKTGDVYELGAESLTALLGDYSELLDGAAFSYAAGDLKSVEVSDGDNHILAEMSGELGGDTPEMKLLSALNNAEIEGEVQGKAENRVMAKGEPVLTLTFTMQTGSIDVIELIPADRNGYFVSVNKVVNFITTERYVKAVNAAMDDYYN